MDVAAGKDVMLEAQLRHLFPKLWDEDARCNAPRVVVYIMICLYFTHSYWSMFLMEYHCR